MRILARRLRETGRDYALRNLKDNIIHLELKPGSMVSENELAAQMGVDPAALARTVKAYNRYCAEGFDRDCFKEREYLVP